MSARGAALEKGSKGLYRCASSRARACRTNRHRVSGRTKKGSGAGPWEAANFEHVRQGETCRPRVWVRTRRHDWSRGESSPGLVKRATGWAGDARKKGIGLGTWGEWAAGHERLKK